MNPVPLQAEKRDRVRQSPIPHAGKPSTIGLPVALIGCVHEASMDGACHIWDSIMGRPGLHMIPQIPTHPLPPKTAAAKERSRYPAPYLFSDPTQCELCGPSRPVDRQLGDFL